CGHVKRRPQSAPVRRVETIVVNGVRRKGRPKLRWEDTLKTDLKELLLSEDMTSDRNSWRTRIRVDEGLYVRSFWKQSLYLWVHALLGVTVYIPPPPYLALAGLGTVVVVVSAFADAQFRRYTQEGFKRLKAYRSEVMVASKFYFITGMVSVHSLAITFDLEL
ncbi:hypothetical protein Tco_1401981, partial [Tanacetum coccineum]